MQFNLCSFPVRCVCHVSFMKPSACRCDVRYFCYLLDNAAASGWKRIYKTYAEDLFVKPEDG